MKNPKVSPAESVVLVKSVTVVELMSVPEASETPEVEIELLPIVGRAVPPVATLAVLIVTVPASAMMCQPEIVQVAKVCGKVT